MDKEKKGEKKRARIKGEGKIKRLQPSLIKINSAHVLEISGHTKQPTNQTRDASMKWRRNYVMKTNRHRAQRVRSMNFSSRMSAKQIDYCNKCLKLSQITSKMAKFG